MKFIAIIPARYASTRFPGKPLAMLGGKLVIRRVYEQAARVLDDVAVATDDERIAETVAAFGGRAVMTSPDHRSGTDRCREAFERLGADSTAWSTCRATNLSSAPSRSRRCAVASTIPPRRSPRS